MRSRRFTLLLFISMAFVVIAVLAVAVGFRSRGVHVTVTNRGPEPVSDVVVHVTGNAHSIGRLGVGESRTVRARPTSESHVELEFVDHLGQRGRLNVGGYFEPGPYEGTIEIELEAGAIVRNDHRVGLSRY